MERKEYLELCQKSSCNQKVYVMYNGVKYIPISYELWFMKGEPRHSAVILSENNPSIIKCRLEDIKKI